MSIALHSKIKQAIENDTLVFFIGSGTSIPLGFPNWDDLVIEILDGLSKDNPSRKNLIPILQDKTFTAIEILEKIKNDKTEIYEIMKKKFSVQFEIEDKKLNRHKKLWDITSKIITTNYDTALESANPKLKPTVYTYDFEISQLPKKDEYLLKMHGTIDEMAKCILFEEDYKKLYDTEEKLVLFQLEKIFSEYTIVFLGFSLQDPYVCNIFENMTKVFNGFINKHFIISTTDDDFSRYSTDVIKIDNWGDALDEILDAMVNVKLSKNLASKETSVTIVEKVIDKEIKEIPKIKIALLLASPIDKPYNFSFNELTKNFDKFDVLIDCHHLSLDVIQELHDYDYFFLYSQTFKNKLCIEDEYFKSTFISLIDLEDNIYCENLKAVFCFTSDDIEIENTLSRPYFIYKEKQNKSTIKQAIYKLFKRSDKKLITSDFKCINIEKVDSFLISLGKASIRKPSTNMPNSIDTKALTDFVGRNTDLEVIIRKIINLRPNGQILTIKGSGGIGKTTIAIKCAHEFSKRGFFSQGIYFIDLEHIENYIQFEHKIAQCFELDNTINFKEHVKLNSLEINSLIILDNFETLLYLKDTIKIQELLKFISDYATVVLTSREIVFSNPSFEDIYTLRDFTTDEAVDLFRKHYNGPIEKEEMQCLRSDIIETLLNKNPLAIYIVAHQLPSGKNIKILKHELEEDFFNTLDEYKYDIYIHECDENIEKSKSLYQSINYSYKKLAEKEKLAFQLLSLFPDGINMENFRTFFISCSKNSCLNQIKNSELKSLEKNSLVDFVDGTIRLQSIIRRFAEHQFNQRSEEEKVLFYAEAFNYNSFLILDIYNLAIKNSRVAYELFVSKSNNFFKSITYINKFEDSKITKMDKLNYIDTVLVNSIHTHCLDKLLHEMAKLEHYFDDIEDGHLLFSLIKINAFYYLGYFDTSFENLNKIISFNDFSDILNKDKIFKSLIGAAFNLYFFEGAAFEFSKWTIHNKMLSPENYNASIFELGKYTKILALNNEKDFFAFEKDFNEGNLNSEELVNYIDNIYSKDHLEKMQIYYLKSKREALDRETINNLVVTNPYTLGLQNMMYAFIEKDQEKTIEYYMHALKELKHIKYYYVECIYYFSNFLKNINHTDYNHWVNTGYTLAKEHYYGFLIYQFECLLGKTDGKYNEDNYPLPEELNFSEYITFIKKQLNLK